MSLQDLSGGNVLLTSSTANPHGFSARVTDFGLARNLDVKARTAPGRYGTITHMVRVGWDGMWRLFVLHTCCCPRQHLTPGVELHAAAVYTA